VRAVIAASRLGKHNTVPPPESMMNPIHVQQPIDVPAVNLEGQEHQSVPEDSSPSCQDSAGVQIVGAPAVQKPGNDEAML
jgi:hypothetical protein